MKKKKFKRSLFSRTKKKLLLLLTRDLSSKIGFPKNQLLSRMLSTMSLKLKLLFTQLLKPSNLTNLLKKLLNMLKKQSLNQKNTKLKLSERRLLAMLRNLIS